MSREAKNESKSVKLFRRCGRPDLIALRVVRDTVCCDVRERFVNAALHDTLDDPPSGLKQSRQSTRPRRL
nr:hypothetical protein CFP56_73158 [Quercus suber]